MSNNLRRKLLDALSKPLPERDQIVHREVFDPWYDIFKGFDGMYSSACDSLMVEALEVVKDQKTFNFINRLGLPAELSLYLLSGQGFTEYGTSPRGGFPSFEVSDLWDELISKWKDYYEIVWGTPFRYIKERE